VVVLLGIHSSRQVGNMLEILDHLKVYSI